MKQILILGIIWRGIPMKRMIQLRLTIATLRKKPARRTRARRKRRRRNQRKRRNGKRSRNIGRMSSVRLRLMPTVNYLAINIPVTPVSLPLPLREVRLP